jgi:hypothetical protein
MRDLRIICDVFLNQPQFGPTVRHHPSKDLTEVLVQPQEVLLQGLLLLLIQVLQESQHALFVLDLVFKLPLELAMFGRVLIKPLNAVAVFVGETLQLSCLLLYLLGEKLNWFISPG